MTLAILTNIVIDSVIDFFERVLLVPSLDIVLVNDGLHPAKSLFLPLYDLSLELARPTADSLTIVG